MITLDKCPLCSKENLVKKLDCIDHSTSNEIFTIVSCETCEFTFTNPIPKEENLGEYYKSDMYISHTNNTKGLFNWMYQTVRKYAVGTKINLLKKISQKENHLDIGCGTGEFLNACQNAGYKVKGIEPSEIARDQAIKNFKLSVSDNTNLNQFKTERKSS